MSEKEYFSIYTNKFFVDKLNSLFKGKDNEIEMGLEAFQEFIDKFKKEVKDDFKNNLESIEEDVVVFRAYMLKAKDSYKKALQEELDGMYKVWEEFDLKRSDNKKKIDIILSDLKPIKTELESIKQLINEIDSAAPKWQLTGMLDTFTKLNNLMSDASVSSIAKFVIENYKNEVKQNG